MAAKFFGEFLLAKDLITQETLDQVLETQRRSRFMLGEIAVTSGILSKLDAQRINFIQQVQNKRFGEIAIELGLLNQLQVDELVLIQQKQRKYIGGFFVELGFFSQGQIAQHLQAHKIEQQQAYQLMLQAINQHPLADYVTAAIEATDRMFLRILHEQSKFYQLIEHTKQLPSFEVVCQIALGEEHRISFCMATSTQTAIKIASLFTHQEIVECDLPFSMDALGEFLNIIVAHLVDNFNDPNTTDRSTPRFDFNLSELLNNAKQMLIVEMDSQIGNFLITISQKQ